MKLTVNGEEIDSRAKTVQELLLELGIKPGAVAVEVNLKIIKRAEHPAYPLSDGDTVEIVSFVGGG